MGEREEEGERKRDGKLLWGEKVKWLVLMCLQKQTNSPIDGAACDSLTTTSYDCVHFFLIGKSAR